MKAKQKANDLLDELCSKAGIYTEQGKECALISIDLAIEFLNNREAFNKTIYLLEVKEEIIKIPH